MRTGPYAISAFVNNPSSLPFYGLVKFRHRVRVRAYAPTISPIMGAGLVVAGSLRLLPAYGLFPLASSSQAVLPPHLTADALASAIFARYFAKRCAFGDFGFVVVML